MSDECALASGSRPAARLCKSAQPSVQPPEAGAAGASAVTATADPPHPNAPPAATAAAARRLQRTDSGRFRNNPVQRVEGLFQRLCDTVEQGAGGSAASHPRGGAPAGSHRPLATNQHSSWDPAQFTPEQLPAVAALAAQVKQLCLELEACADAVVAAAAELPGRSLQALLVSPLVGTAGDLLTLC